MNAVIIVTIIMVMLLGVIWPRRGLLASWRRAQAFSRRTRREDALKHILKSEANGRTASLDSIAGALQISTGTAAELLEELEKGELLSFEVGHLKLTPAGRELGLHVVRAHRLWESYLAEQTGVSEKEWHHRAEKQEHLLTPEETAALEARLGHPMRDPHGDAIPGKSDSLEGEISQSLNMVEAEKPFLLSHLEDEPETVYRQLLALGLRPGMRAFVIDRSATRIRLWAEGREHVLTPVLAENVSIQLIPEFRTPELFEEDLLSELLPGQGTHVVGLSPACHGVERRRLLDLGFVPGTLVEVEMVSPAGDPTAYRVRGSVVALRREQASLIRVKAKQAAAA